MPGGSDRPKRGDSLRNIPREPGDNRALQKAREVQKLARAEKLEVVAEGMATGRSVRDLAKLLGVSIDTARGMVGEITAELQLGSLPSLTDRINHSVMVLRRVQQEAWKVVRDPELSANSQNRVAGLGVVQAAQAQIDKLQGTQAPDSINSRAVGELYDVLFETLVEVGAELGLGPALQSRFLAKLARKTGQNTGSGLVLGGTAETPTVVEASRVALPAADTGDDDLFGSDDAIADVAMDMDMDMDGGDPNSDGEWGEE